MYPQSAYRKGGVFNLRLNTPVAKATSLFRKRNSEPLTAPSAEARFRACGHDQRTEPVWRLCDRPLETFARSPFQLYDTQRWQVAAALSAAVTTTIHQGTALTFQAEPSKQNHPNPNASRSSGGSAREGLLSEKPPPSHTPASLSLREGVRGRGFSFEKPPPPESPLKLC